MQQQPQENKSEEIVDVDWSKAFSDFPDFTFWYGLSIEDLMKVPRWLLEIYAEKLPALLAQQQQMLISAAAFPHMKRSAQQSTVSRLSRLQTIYRDERPKRQKTLSDLDVAHTAAGFGIGYKVAPPKERDA